MENITPEQIMKVMEVLETKVPKTEDYHLPSVEELIATINSATETDVVHWLSIGILVQLVENMGGV